MLLVSNTSRTPLPLHMTGSWAMLAQCLWVNPRSKGSKAGRAAQPSLAGLTQRHWHLVSVKVSQVSVTLHSKLSEQCPVSL